VDDAPAPSERCADVVLLVGPSGSGKTYLAKSVGLPILALDDFYRADTDPGMPRTADGKVDWEHPASWDPRAAVDALEALCCGDEVTVPDYSFSENRAVGTKTLRRAGARVVVAEGIFAAELIEPLRATGLLADALLIRQDRWVTFARRLIRDLRESRKSRWYLVTQGWAKTMAEPAVVARQLGQGARPVTKPEARAILADLAARPEIIPEAPATASTLATDPVATEAVDGPDEVRACIHSNPPYVPESSVS